MNRLITNQNDYAKNLQNKIITSDGRVFTQPGAAGGAGAIIGVIVFCCICFCIIGCAMS